MADQQQQGGSGFVLPQPGQAQDNAASTSAPQAPAPLIQIGAGGEDTSSRDLLVGGGILLVLLIAFFFARNGYANMLVRKRVPPGKANAAGWWLFVFLASVSTGVVLSAVNSAKFMTPLIIGPLGVVGLLGLVLMLLSGRR
ncbi:hypothetical protein [Azoarcus sp. TTM-91]|uniref:hypothetical protein n=1 Tax=Azoarcus sp. TTM-91 TaxID=2691581 RepID=UPI001B7CE271|nr:hypothetical protein [Azoarcus sp. TTM-91]